MIIIKQATEATIQVQQIKKTGQTIGFVPTMGALHQGHISIIERSKTDGHFTICSIFVNPTQFNNPVDFEKYPISIEQDIELLQKAGCDMLFLPSVEEIYPANFIKKHYELGNLETVLEGSHRPGHFQGVCLVVERLLNIIPTNVMYLGEKDFQQCMVIERMLELTGLPVKLTIAPTIREKNGLAMSSRNRRLGAAEVETATTIYAALSHMREKIHPGALSDLQKEAQKMLENQGFIVDYVAITNRQLLPVDYWDGKLSIVALIAATLHDVRLIDNLSLA